MSPDSSEHHPASDTPTSKLDLLKQTQVFGILETPVLERLIEEGREVLLNKGEVLIEEGSAHKSVYIILFGEVLVTKGQKQVALLKNGDLLGEMSMIDLKPRSANAQARRQTLLLEISEDQFQNSVGANPDALWEMLKVLVNRLRGFLDSLEHDILSLGNFTHDIKNCLTPLGYVEFWTYELLSNLRGTQNGHQPRRGWDTAQKCYDTVATVKSNLLTMVDQGLARVKNKHAHYSKDKFELAPLMEETIHEIRMHKTLQGKHIRLEARGDPGRARFNYLDIKRVLQNLLVNAGYVTEPEGEIRVTVYGLDDRIQVSVQDFGPGIDADTRELLFKDVYTSKPDGNGFGLLSCREIIEDFHQGRIHFETEQGKGSTFTFEIARDPAE